NKKIVRARVLDVVEPSAERVPAPCSHFGRCGGCQYQHMPYAAQLRYKSEILRETLRRIGRIRWEGPIETRTSPPFEYRNRAQWQTRREQGEASSLSIGYFEAGSTRLVAVDQCPILSPRLAETLALLRTLLASSPSLAAIDEIEAFADADDAKILLNVSGE